jgi:hypothetical protein
MQETNQGIANTRHKEMANTFVLSILKEFDPKQQNEMLSHIKNVIVESRIAAINDLTATTTALKESMDALKEI